MDELQYLNRLNSLENPGFASIQNIAIECIESLPKPKQDKLWNDLEHGVRELDSHELLCMYLRAFGNMHEAKLIHAFRKIPIDLFSKAFEVIDWGCGQALATTVLIDFLKTNGFKENLKKVTLIEPSLKALERALVHTKVCAAQTTAVLTINDYFENINSNQIASKSGLPQIHIFSNILDVKEINLKYLANLVDKTIFSESLLVCVGPLNKNNERIDAYLRYFDINKIQALYAFESYDYLEARMRSQKTCKIQLYKLIPNNEGHLIPIKFYPTVQFQSAYELDIIGEQRKSKLLEFSGDLTHFDVAAPFDIGASVYDDIHPVFAVLSNIITRGLPTRASLYVEERFQEAFNLTERVVESGEIKYVPKKHIDLKDVLKVFDERLNGSNTISPLDHVKLQLLLSPIAIARFQKVLVEAILTEKLSLDKSKWEVLVEELDVPFAEIAIDDFKQLFYSLTQLSEDYSELKLPEIALHVISNKDFIGSPLHSGFVMMEPTNEMLKIKYDLVVTQSVLQRASGSIESFSKYECWNNCYFNIRSIDVRWKERAIYTTSLITYKSLVQKTVQGKYVELEDTKRLLTYFLRLIFRKVDFRPGQLPILNRALKNQSVIGLLPTGGGKSLTYQLAALLQPGVTLVIDPLKSLMNDQYEGLINNGIDCCTYINSSLTIDERALREKQLEASKLLIVFMSPERLSIATFRERLKNMHDNNVYFSYGVIDEVHCVSEWGHDFRFTYLHLGRNLYHYVRSKDGQISLFGLTATASFDVLADVERELSGYGIFELDSETIVRYENTNRLELQYKIEKVSVRFEDDRFFDTKKLLKPHLPKAKNITNHWTAFDTKGLYTQEYIQLIPGYLNDLQKKSTIEYIKQKFVERQNDAEGVDAIIDKEMPADYYREKSTYSDAGIIFCPHVDSTGISVGKVARGLKGNGVIDVGRFSGKDDDKSSMKNLEAFRLNKIPIMVATKAFGMGIDKPNVRFTINTNFSSSLESFVQEAGRAGRDRKMALSTILISDYSLVKIQSSCSITKFPMLIIRDKWFYKSDLELILKEYNLTIPEDDIIYATPTNDIVMLYCHKNNKAFEKKKCNEKCTNAFNCSLAKVNDKSRGWMAESELVLELKEQGLNISKKNFQYLNPDYSVVMYFFSMAFKGDVVEKMYMNRILNKIEVDIQLNNGPRKKEIGFLNALKTIEYGEKIIVYIPYVQDDEVDKGLYDELNTYSNISKAIYRMCCIELVEDFTQDYIEKEFRIVAVKKKREKYYEGLARFLQRYYTKDRAKLEVDKAKEIVLKSTDLHDIEAEIYRCLAYLTEFVYDKISEKRKRAIDYMRNFCIEGLNGDWIEANETLKDNLFYYFNSKYARKGYTTDSGEPFSLVDDTEEGKVSDVNILFKYLRVIDDDVVGTGVPVDNVKHLYGAVRLISRSLTDSNPTLALLEAFCLAYLELRGNDTLEQQLLTRYSEGFLDFFNRGLKGVAFWDTFKIYNDLLTSYLDNAFFESIKEKTIFGIHLNQVHFITKQYTEEYE